MKKTIHNHRLSIVSAIQPAKVNQLQIEINTWKRFLNFIMEENISLKNRLADILKNGFDRKLLDKLEDFQTKFIRQDEIVSLLRNEIAELDEYFNSNSPDGIESILIDDKIDFLRNQILNSEKHFFQLHFNFNTYLSENI